MIALDHAFFMKKALLLAQQAYDEGEVPIGAIIVANNEIIGKGYNQVERLFDSTAHAEMLAITAAFNHLQAKFLDQCILYVTIQPCVMCAGAIKNARLSKVVYGANEPKTGCSMHLQPEFLNHKTEWINGIMTDECAALMKNFFTQLR